MFNIFKKKKHQEVSVPNQKGRKTNEQDNSTNFVFSIESVPKEYRNNKIWVKYWEAKDGDRVKKGDKLGELEIHDLFTVSPIDIITEEDGILEILKQSPTNTFPNLIKDKDKLFYIHHKDVDRQKALELKNKRFANIPQIIKDEFSGTTEIKWESVAGRKKQYSYDTDIYDSFIFYSADTNYNKLIFTLNNISSKDYIVFKYPTKDYKLTIGAIISFLFDNGERLEFEITTKPYKHSEHINWGYLFETRVQLTTQELVTLKNQDFSKWQIKFAKSSKKITGHIDSSDTQFAIKKFVQEYYELVQNHIGNYQPFTNKEQRATETFANNEECYIYLMVDLTNNYHKIGISNKPEYREKTLQSEKPTIKMLCNMRFPNRKLAVSFEQALHQTYADKRIRGEWFNLTDKEIQELKDVLTN